jgi:glutathione S-transferase
LPALDGLDERLAAAPWLLGDRISVLEIAWFISVHQLVMVTCSLERHPPLRAHYEKLLARPALGAEVRGRGLPGFVSRGYGACRRLRGTTLGELLAAVNTA